MLTTLLHRLQQRLRRIEPARRIEVCPPALLRRAGMAAPGWRGGLRAWLGAGWSAEAPARSRRAAPAGLPEVRNEFVLRVTGIVRPRLAGKENPKLATGAIELEVTELEILNAAKVLPFAINDRN